MSAVKSDKQNVVIPAGQDIKVKCRVKVEHLDAAVPVVFEPDELQLWPEELRITEKLLTVRRGQRRINLNVSNTSGHDVILRGGTDLGRLELVTSVTPTDVVYKGVPEEVLPTMNVPEEETVDSSITKQVNLAPVVVDDILDDPKFDPPVQISEKLSADQKDKIRTMLREESACFMKNEDDIGLIDNL